MDFALIEKILSAGKNQYKAFAEAEEAIKILSGKANYAKEIESRIAALGKQAADAEEYFAEIQKEAAKFSEENKTKIGEAEKAAAGIIDEAKRKASEAFGKAEEEAKSARDEVNSLKAEAAVIKKQIADDKKTLAKLQDAKTAALKALGV